MSYPYSYSGSDFQCAAFFHLYDNDKNPVVSSDVRLDSLVTISVSIHEAKGQVRSIGKRNVSGHTSSSRTVAGTMIFNIINHHPLKDLINQYWTFYDSIPRWGNSRDYALSSFDNNSNPKKMAYPTTLPPFNIKIFGVTELSQQFSGSSAFLLNREDVTADVTMPYLTALLTGVELTLKSTTISVNNILTEEVYEFVASGFDDFIETNGNFNLSDTAKIELLYDYYVNEEVDLDILQDLNTQKVSPPQKVYNPPNSKYSFNEPETFLTNSSTGRKHYAK